MAGRRFGPLIVLVVAATGLVLGRLFQVQILEHDAWANEAANLVRSGAVEPYERGRIIDGAGRVLAHDENVYRVEFRYRDFRRGHPLGQVAHAWSAVEGRPVPLVEAFARFREAAEALVQLTDAELAAFADGEELDRGVLYVPAEDKAERLRLGRRSDVRYYMSRLLGLDRREALDAVRDEGTDSMSAFVLQKRRMTAEELGAELAEKLALAEEDLRQLAVLLADADGDEFEGPRSPEADLAALIDRLEDWREGVEDATASELFREAAGFSAGRVTDRTLLERFDLGWLAALMRWDGERIHRWAVDAREGWRFALADWHLERLRLEIDFATEDQTVPEAVVKIWSRLFLAEPPDEGSALRPLVVVSELDSLFDMRVPRRMRVARLPVLPLQDPALAPAAGATTADLARLELWRGAAPDEERVSRRAAEWDAHLGEQLDRAWAVERAHDRILDWESQLQAELGAQLELLAAHKRTDRLKLSDGRLDRAEERARSVLKDRGSRPSELTRRPDYALVHLLTRYPDRFAGFLVRESPERMLVEDERGVVALGPLLGNVRAPALRVLMEEREESDDLAALLRRGRRSVEEDRNLERLVKEVTQIDELLGDAGIEGHFDRELSGKNGYLEQRGLREMRAGKGTTDIPPVDGLDVALTLDLALQDAAVDCLRNPRRDPTGEKMDEDWLRQPTGAIVFARVNGDVLAAASFPDLDRGSGKGRDLALERTLRKPGFLPAGSVFKPFVAVWALDHLEGYDPHERLGCFLLEDGSGSGWGSMRCWRQYGHAEVALHQAIAQSCNGYFAWLGSQLTTEDFRGLTREFGFGRPTGVRTFPDRGGLREDTNQALLRDDLKGREFLMAGNGLGVIEVTPMQVARAYAGLATGRLPEMRLVDRVGGEPLPRTSRPLDLSQAALARVRAGLADVTNGERGSGRNALSTAALGFRISAKTGSADYTAKSVDGRGFDKIVLKHTWLAGWFPPEDPEFVLVVFVHRTVATSGHSSIWIAQDFLQREAVQALLTEDGEGR